MFLKLFFYNDLDFVVFGSGRECYRWKILDDEVNV